MSSSKQLDNLAYLTRLFRFAFKEFFPELLGDTRELSKVFFETVTVKPVGRDINDVFGKLVDQIQYLKEKHQDTTALQEEIDSRLAMLYGLSDNDLSIITGSITA